MVFLGALGAVGTIFLTLKTQTTVSAMLAGYCIIMTFVYAYFQSLIGRHRDAILSVLAGDRQDSFENVLEAQNVFWRVSALVTVAAAALSLTLTLILTEGGFPI